MNTYYVHVEQFWTYKVTADSPEDAEQIVLDGDGPRGDCIGYSTVAVTLTDDEFADDLRQPGQCRGCGKSMDPGATECTDCLLARIKKSEAAVS